VRPWSLGSAWSGDRWILVSCRKVPRGVPYDFLIHIQPPTSPTHPTTLVSGCAADVGGVVSVGLGCGRGGCRLILGGVNYSRTWSWGVSGPGSRRSNLTDSGVRGGCVRDHVRRHALRVCSVGCCEYAWGVLTSAATPVLVLAGPYGGGEVGGVRGVGRHWGGVVRCDRGWRRGGGGRETGRVGWVVVRGSWDCGVIAGGAAW